MTYTAAQTAPLAARLVQDLPGLNINVATVWITAESGNNNNPLGVMVNGKLAQYATPQAGIDAAAARVKTLSYYTGIVASLPGGNARQQAMAIIASPWNVPNSPYYTRIFTAAGLLGTGGGATRPVATVTVPITTATATATATLVGYDAATTARIVALEGYIATLTKDVATNNKAGNVAAAATDQASLTKYAAELSSLLAAAPKVSTAVGAGTLPSPTGVGGVLNIPGGPAGIGVLQGTPIGTTMLGAWGSIVSFPVGHVLTATDVNTIMNALNAADAAGAGCVAENRTCFFAGINPISGAAGQATVRAILTANVGQVWGTPLEQTLQAQFGTAATNANPVGNAITGALAGLGGTFTTVFTYLAALIVVGLGIFLYSKGNNGQQQMEVPGATVAQR